MANPAVRYERLTRALRQGLGVFRAKGSLLRELAALKVESEELRSRLVAAQQAKVTAANQAEEARREKERLRIKAAGLKKEVDHLGKVAEQLNAKIVSLRDENDSLKKSLEASRAQRRRH